ncbi:MAG: protein-L-isoaspartate(D-aspartate) O-methyltransferase [Deltaproteobacteria bacterium]|nr:protein-L-isoaspartate(D-aspartate) O-methyltransferase [Deltaproteobacteria bacterium]
MEEYTELRRRMVVDQISSRGITNAAVLSAMTDVPREKFVNENIRRSAYTDGPLPIACGQTISQPYMVALMAELLLPLSTDVMLEVGTGSGYAAAVLSRVVKKVYTVERHPDLAEEAKKRFAALGYNNIEVHIGDGTLGWAEHAPYDGILVAAGGPRAPRPLLEQLAMGGRLVIPVGPTQMEQVLTRFIRRGEEQWDEETFGEVRFVPLIGAGGWQVQ